MKSIQDIPRYVPVTHWSRYYEWPSISGLRYLIFHANSNGFANAFKRVGRRVLVDTETFWDTVKAQGGSK